MRSSRNVGFLRYWSWSNLPLFLIAGPMLAIMVFSAAWGLNIVAWPTQVPTAPVSSGRGYTNRDAETESSTASHSDPMLRRMAVPQLIVAVLAISNYHVQIVNRISSGYVVWYWWLACAIVDHGETQATKTRPMLLEVTVRWVVIYALVQAALFASFLPPA